MIDVCAWFFLPLSRNDNERPSVCGPKIHRMIPLGTCQVVARATGRSTENLPLSHGAVPQCMQDLVGGSAATWDGNKLPRGRISANADAHQLLRCDSACSGFEVGKVVARHRRDENL